MVDQNCLFTSSPLVYRENTTENHNAPPLILFIQQLSPHACPLYNHTIYTKFHPTIDDLQCPDGSTVHLDKDKAEILNQFFTSVFTHENLSVIPSFTLDHAVPSLHTVKISPSIVAT